MEEIKLAAGTILRRAAAGADAPHPPVHLLDKDPQDLGDTLADTENAIFVMTSVIEEKFGKLRPRQAGAKADHGL